MGSVYKEGEMKILFIMAKEPYTHDFNTLIRLSEAALNRGHKVKIFFISNGVYCLLKNEIKELKEKGADIYYCSHNTTQRGVKPEDFAESNSTYGLSKMIKEVDKVIMLS